ncbi:MarR family winged helix-turn-helix transcriptional regulator [Arthrobacter sp. H14-L1]|uniref:MarR family winged helix-turn-helix transcriptional regulator n=1 Tax=Arthrobacter sp. H14-L1 TaxID=2996697 RepID=UPI00226F3BE2|nr:MarR family transcriptional regulator [Arthrobacter sp. H14-L1]MCY0906468.1 MarR family transcriptional regulator [Arthrobacter sp. H14-L1]
MPVAQHTAAELVYCIFDLQRTLRCTTTASAQAADLGVALEGVLRIVAGGEPVRASDVAARLGVGASALSRQAADLEEHNFIFREPDPADGRAYLLSASEKGRTYLAEIEHRRASTVQQMLAGWSEEEAASTAHTVQHLTATLRAAVGPQTRTHKYGTIQDHQSQTLAGEN